MREMKDKTIMIGNVSLTGNFFRGLPYQDGDKTICIPGGIFGDKIIKIEKEPKDLLCECKTDGGSAMFNGWFTYNRKLNKMEG